MQIRLDADVAAHAQEAADAEGLSVAKWVNRLVRSQKDEPAGQSLKRVAKTGTATLVLPKRRSMRLR